MLKHNIGIIASIKKIKVEEPTFNLAVSEDESYTANGIIVHNCRSTLVPITAGESENSDSYFYQWDTNKKEFPTWGTGISENAVKPAKGFGG